MPFHWFCHEAAQINLSEILLSIIVTFSLRRAKLKKDLQEAASAQVDIKEKNG